MTPSLKKNSPSQTTRSISKSLYEKALKVIPGGVNSPVRAFQALGIHPLVVKQGKGSKLVDADGNSYIDYCGSWGALIHGHCHPAVTAAAIKQVEQGSTFGILTETEVTLAAKVTKLMPSMPSVRFVSSGTEATMSAIRLARGFTGRSLIVKFSGHYHGHADHLLVQAGSGLTHLNPASSSLGVPADFVKHTLCLPFNATEQCRAVLREKREEIAAVIVEPIAANMGVVPPQKGFLEMLREETQKNGSLLIFDEVITGFRVALQGAQGLFGITPDLTTLGKIVGGGFPAAAFGGRRHIMEHLAPLGGVYQAGTLSGNPVAMEAGLAALTLLETPHFYQTLHEKTKILTHPIQEKLRQKKLPACLQEVGSLFTLFFGSKQVLDFEDVKKLDPVLFKRFFCFLLERGVYFSPLQCEANFVSMAHSEEDLLYTRDVILEFLDGC